MDQKSAVVQQVITNDPQAIPRTFSAVNRQIAGPLDLDDSVRSQYLSRQSYLSHDRLVGDLEVPKSWSFDQVQNDRIHPATGPGNDRCAAAMSAEYRNAA